MTTSSRNHTKYKIIVAGIKDIVTDGRRKMVYMDSFDNCIDEIFGVQHFCRKINNAYSNREIIEIIERVGSDILYDIFTNKRLRGILREMTQMDKRIHSLRKDLRKQGKRGSRDKYDLKEYNWLRKTFKESAKYMRSRFGIKNSKSAYKRRYKNISDVLKSRDEYEFSPFSFGDDYDDFEDYERSFSDYNDFEDDYDDYEDRTELDDFEIMMNGRKDRRPRQAKRSRKQSNSYDFEDEWNDDDDEDDEKFVDDDLEKKVDKIAENVMYLAETVQFLNNKSNYDSARIRDLRNYAAKDIREKNMGYRTSDDDLIREMGHTSGRSVKPDLETEVGIINNFVEKMGGDVIQLKKNDKLLAKALDEILTQNKEIIETFNAIFDDNDDSDDEDDDINYSVEEAFTKPVVVNNKLDELVNHAKDPYEMLNEEDDDETSEEVVTNGVVGSTVRELVDQINKSNDKPVVTAEPSDIKEVNEEAAQ